MDKKKFSSIALQQRGKTDAAVMQRADSLEFRRDCINLYVSLGLLCIIAYISEIRGSHSGVIEDSAHPGCDAVCVCV